jgi:putative flippase GtrA
MRYLNSPRFRYLLVGFFGAIFEFFIFSYLVYLKFTVFVSNVFAYHLAIVICYFLHFFFTHRMVKLNATSIRFIKYISLMYIQFLIGMVILWILIIYLEVGIEASKIIQIALVTPVSYFLQNIFIFTKKKL